ncbi:MAG: NAD(P)/FAD-dependent oxidoreductase [Gammaproteobacteria bacterium]|nr:NAD(P)/FAD-dependent oxidoreductase [Gammaproteobacteria bacterium]
MEKCDVLIIGAGAAGLMCAIETAKRGKHVMLIDHANKAGKKILMSGGGRCNFTNLQVGPENFISHNPHFCKSALSRYQPADFVQLVKKHRIPFHEKTLGQLFCDNKSKDILNMLLTECERNSVNLTLNAHINKITSPTANQFMIETSNGLINCQSLVIATGGLSIPTMGTSPFAYKVAEQFGIKVWPTRAGLVPFTLHQKAKEKLLPLAGIAIDCVVSCNEKSFREAMLFTHRGLSGPAMLQISSYWEPGNMLNIKLLPEYNLFEQLKSAQKEASNTTLKTYLCQYFPKRQVQVWLGTELEPKTLQTCSHEKLQSIANLFQRWEIKPNGTEGYRTAEVTLGGVDCNAISSKTFEANNTPGLYFIGEALDVTGWLGGYNFQWAWASGFAAGNAI